MGLLTFVEKVDIYELIIKKRGENSGFAINIKALFPVYYSYLTF